MKTNETFILVLEAVCCPNVPIIKWIGCGNWIQPLLSIMFVISIYPKKIPKSIAWLKWVLLGIIKTLTLVVYYHQRNQRMMKPVQVCVPGYISKYSFPDPVIFTATIYTLSIVYATVKARSVKKEVDFKFVVDVAVPILKLVGYSLAYYFSFLILPTELMLTILLGVVSIVPVLIFVDVYWFQI